ncbi:MAG: hypothetical protein QM784_19670 [Polyangiaceae bacterium]
MFAPVHPSGGADAGALTGMGIAMTHITRMNSTDAFTARRIEAHSDEDERRAYSATRWTVLLLCLAAAFTILPLWQPLLLAAFVAIVAEPLYLRLYRKVEGRSSAAALLTLLLAVFALIPIVISDIVDLRWCNRAVEAVAALFGRLGGFETTRGSGLGR